MVPVTHWKRLAFGQKIDNRLKLLEVISSFSQAFDIPRDRLVGQNLSFLPVLKKCLDRLEFLNFLAAWLFSRVDEVSSLGIATGKGKPPLSEICR